MAQTERSQGIFSLPNEILLNIFSTFPSKDLLSFGLCCRRLHSIALRILQHRLQLAACLDGHTLYLECGPPAAKWTTSKVYCSELCTNGMKELVEEIQQNGGSIGHVERMGRLYSRFRPVNKEPDFRSVPRPHPAGDIPGSRTYQADVAAAWKSYADNAVSRSVHIDADMMFSQLEAVAYLGRRESTRGLLFSIQEVCDGTIRVWRDWLARQCESKRWSDGEPVAIRHDDHDGHSGKIKERSGSMSALLDPHKDPSILWLNTPGEHVGVKFRVKEQKWRRGNPVLFASDLEVPVSYTVELEEVLIRTTHLLMKLEDSRKQILNQSGKALIFGSYMEH